MKGFTNQGGSDAYFVKYDSNNQQQLVLQWGSVLNEFVSSVAAVGYGGVYVTVDLTSLGNLRVVTKKEFAHHTPIYRKA